MITIIIRAFILYLLLLVLLRLMGKRQIAQMQPFELVLTIIIADLATIPMGELSVPLLHGIIPLLTLSVIHFVLTVLTKRSAKMNTLISGKPIIIINPQGIDHQALNNLKLSVDDVFASLRAKGFFKLEHVEYAIMETNGMVNVMPKYDFAPVTNKDLKLPTQAETIPVTLISEGNLNKNNLEVAKISLEIVNKILQKAKIKKIKDCVVLTVDNERNVYVQAKNKKYEFFKEMKW